MRQSLYSVRTDRLTADKQGVTISTMAGMDAKNSAETTLNGVRAVLEIRWEDTSDGDIAELAYLVLFNEREAPLRVRAGDTEGTVGPRGGFTEILTGYRTSKQSWTIPNVDTDVGRVTWNTETYPPKVQIDPEFKLS